MVGSTSTSHRVYECRKEISTKDIQKIRERGLVNKAELKRVLHLTNKQRNKLWQLVVEQDGYSIIDDTRIRLCVAEDLLGIKKR